MTVDVRPYAPEGHAPAPPIAATAPGRARGIGRLADRPIRLEPWIVLPCALLLLAYPNPLVIPAGLVGILPSVARLLATGRPWRPTLFDLPIALLVVGALLGGLASLNRDAAAVRLTGLLAGLLLFAAAREHARTDRRARILVSALLATGALATLGLLIVVAPFLLLDHVPPLAGLVRVLDQWDVGRRMANEDWLLQRYRFRASGVGAMADVGLVLVLATLVGVRSRWAWPPLGLLALFFVGALVASDNRGSMLAAVLVVGAVAAAWRRRLLILLPIGAAVLGAALALGAVERGLSLRTVAQRFWFWENAAYLARELPFTGAGLGLDSARLTYQAYFQPIYPPFSHAHNIYLQALLEQGTFGVLGLFGLVAATLWLGWHSDRAPERWVMAARLAGFGIALTMLTAGLSEIAALSTFGGALMLGGMGLLAATASPRSAATARPDLGVPEARHRRGRSGLTVPGSRPAWLAVGLLVVLVALTVTGGGRRLATVALLNAGTAELNRGTISEWVDKSERTDAIERATWLLRAAADLDPNDPAVQRNLGLALAARGDEREAKAAVERARDLVDWRSVTATQDTFQVGRAYVALNTWGEAIRAWQAAGAGPQLLQLGNRLLERTRSYDQATNAFTAAATVEPRSRGAYEGIARVARQRSGEPDDVVRALQPLAERGGDYEYMARLEMARAYREAGRLEEALATVQAAERLGSGPEVSFELGLLYSLAERWSGTNQLFVRATDDLPLEADSWYWLAYSLLRQGQPSEALAVADRGFTEANLERRGDRAQLLTVRGEALLALGRPNDALAQFQEALALRQNDARLREDVERARAAIAGAAPNLLVNPSFAWDGSWALRPESQALGYVPLGDRRPSIADGVLRIAAEAPRRVVQQVLGLEPGATYRLTARARRDGTEPATAELRLVDRARPSGGTAYAWTTRQDWTTLELAVTVGSRYVDVQLALTPDAATGAVLFDDVRLVRVSPPR